MPQDLALVNEKRILSQPGFRYAAPMQEAAQWRDWMIAAQGGNQNAYRRLLTALQPLLTNFLRKRLPNELIDDTVQEILIALHNARQTYDPKQPFPAWLFGIARHKQVDALRKYGRLNQYEAISWEEVETFLPVTTKTKSEQSDHYKDLSAAMAKLKPNQAKVVQLLKVEGYSLAEVASETGQSVAAVKVTAHRAYKALRQHLGSSYEQTTH